MTRLAVERRRKRAAAAGVFLAEDWPAVVAGIRSRDAPQRPWSGCGLRA